MPLTFPAHQAPVLPLKLWRPGWFDGTALCIGAAAPDVAYSLGVWLSRQSHTAIGLTVWAVPFTLVATFVVRWRAAAGVAAQVPDAGPLRLRSYGVLGRRWHAPWITLSSALVGATSHILIDAFTHTGRWGANWLGLNGVIAEVPLRGDLTVARLLQMVGHLLGSLVGLALFAHIGRRRLLERWYGADAVRTARAAVVRPIQRALFWAVALGFPLAAGTWRLAIGRNPIFPTLTATVLGLLVAGTLPLHRPPAAPGG